MLFRSPHNIPIRCGEESLVVRVEYQWLPFLCTKCIKFGHKVEECEKGGENVPNKGG